jgi:elongation factor P
MMIRMKRRRVDDDGFALRPMIEKPSRVRHDLDRGLEAQGTAQFLMQGVIARFGRWHSVPIIAGLTEKATSRTLWPTMASPSEIKKGVVLKNDQGLWVVNEFQHVNPGKGAAFVRTRIKNLQTGKVLEATYKTSESVDIVEVEHRRMQYLYHDQSGYTFMDQGTYEQVTMSDDDVGEQGKYLRDGMEVSISTYEGQPIALELPRKMTLKVVEALPAVAGNTASGGNLYKEIVLEGGIKVQAPLFIKEGEEVIINTETGEYVERA